MRRAASLKGWLAGLVILLASSGLAFVALSTRTEANMNFANGQKLSGPFADYWRANGGLQRFGQPVTGVYATSDGYPTQIFERAAFVYDRSVLEYPIGWAALSTHCTEPAFQRAAQGSGSGSKYFPTTGHNLSGAFLAYWNGHNGLATYGYPLSEEFTEKLGDGNSYTVQYFERARFEMHGTGVQLGLLGSELLASQGGASLFANLPTPSSYPAQARAQQQQNSTGHAPDYGWVEGRVQMDTWSGTGPAPMRPSYPPSVVIGSSLFPAPVQEDEPTPLPNGVIVGHAVHSDVSPPLRDIKPRPSVPECSPQAGYTYVPTGPGWDPTNLKNGEYVRLTGHLAAPGEVQPMGDQGRVYVVDKVEVLP